MVGRQWACPQCDGRQYVISDGDDDAEGADEDGFLRTPCPMCGGVGSLPWHDALPAVARWLANTARPEECLREIRKAAARDDHVSGADLTAFAGLVDAVIRAALEGAGDGRS